MSEKKTGSEGAFPVGEFYKQLEGFNLLKTQNFWEAVVVTESPGGQRQVRLYRWRNKGGTWKVDLARFNISGWNVDELASKVKELKQKYGISG